MMRIVVGTINVTRMFSGKPNANEVAGNNHKVRIPDMNTKSGRSMP